MKHPRLILLFSILALVIGVLQVLGERFYLYWHWRWFDIPMHILSGFFIATALYIILSYRVPPRPYTLKLFLLIYVVTLCIGLWWEYFEYSQHLIYAARHAYRVDTLKDIIDDSVGVLLSFLYLRTYFNRATITS